MFCRQYPACDFVVQVYICPVLVYNVGVYEVHQFLVLALVDAAGEVMVIDIG